MTNDQISMTQRNSKKIKFQLKFETLELPWPLPARHAFWRGIWSLRIYNYE